MATLREIKQLANQLDTFRAPLGTQIYDCVNKTMSYINTWKPSFVYYVETLMGGDPPQVTQEEKTPTDAEKQVIYDKAKEQYLSKSQQVLNSYLNYFKTNKDVNVEAIDTYVAQFSSLMQLIALPNFDTQLVKDLGKYNCLTYDNIFYLMDDVLNVNVRWTLANGTLYTGKAFKIFLYTNTEGFITHTALNEWASSYYSVLIPYEGRPTPITKKPYPSVTFDLVLSHNASKGDVSVQVREISDAISKTNSDIINFLTYSDFEVKNQNPTTPELNVIVPPTKDDLMYKVYTKHKANDMYIYLGHPEKCKYSKAIRIAQTQAYHRSLNITRESLIEEVKSKIGE